MRLTATDRDRVLWLSAAIMTRLTATTEARRLLNNEHTLRFLGQDTTLTGWQWLELHDLISSITHDGQEQRARIAALLERAS